MRKETLSELIDLAGYAPTGSNTQSVEWLVLGDGNDLRRLAGVTVDCMRWMQDNRPEVASAIRLDRVIRRWEKGDDVIVRGAPVVVVTHASKEDFAAPVSSAIALSYLESAATCAGLGCCRAGYFHMAAAAFPPMAEVLPIPEDHRCTGAMMAGYPRYRYRRPPPRKPPAIAWRL